MPHVRICVLGGHNRGCESHLSATQLFPQTFWNTQPQGSFLSILCLSFMCNPSRVTSVLPFTMTSTPQAYEALPSETTSISQSQSQQDSQLRREKADQSKPSPNTKLLGSAYLSHLWVNWKWESAACVLVLATPIIIFATLHPHSGHPLPQWPFKISINSLLSVYALVFKAAIGFILTSCIGQLQWTWFSETRPLADMLHFDSATRGPDGALGLIWRQRFQHPLTALGCITAVIVITVDPFVQQLVRPVDCSVEQSGGNGVANLPRANVFNLLYYNGTFDTPGFSDDLSPFEAIYHSKVAQGILHEAVYAPGRDPPWQCSTGNCTFHESYGSIGICYSCEDVSTDVSLSATCSDTNSSYASHHPTTWTDCPSNSTFTLTTNYTNDKNVAMGVSVEVPNGTLFDATLIVAGSDSVQSWPGQKENYFRVGGSLDFGFLTGDSTGTSGRTDWTFSDTDYQKCDSEEGARSWSCRGFGATTCSLQPCVQVYNATITAGKLEERLIESSSDAPWGIVYDEYELTAYSALVDKHCSAKIQTPTVSDTTNESRWLPYNLNLSTGHRSSSKEYEVHLPDDATLLIESGCLYLAAVDDVFRQVAKQLKGTVQANVHLISEGTQLPGDDHPFTRLDIDVSQGPELIRGIYNWGHTDFDRVQSVVANMSNSLTTYIRTHGGSTQVPGSANFSRDVQGVVHQYAICLQVQWLWITFPACLAIVTTVFFLTVVGTTTRQWMSIWKTSPLAWVLRAEGLAGGPLSFSDGSCKAMEERSKQIAVHLSEEDRDGPRIHMADLKDPNML